MSRLEDIRHQAADAFDHASRLDELLRRAMADPTEAMWAFDTMRFELNRIVSHLAEIDGLAAEGDNQKE